MTKRLVRALDQSPTTSPTPLLPARPIKFKKRIRPYQRPTTAAISTTPSSPVEATSFIHTKSGLVKEGNSTHPALSECNFISKKIVTTHNI